jgi:hypothetical protein
MSSEVDKVVRAIETGAVITLLGMVLKGIVSWASQNWIILAVFFGIVWLHDTGTGHRSRAEKISAFPTASVTVSDATYQKASGDVPDYFVATVTNGGPVRIYDVSITCFMHYRSTETREHTSRVSTFVNLGYINASESTRLRLNADGSGLLLVEDIRVESCSPNFSPEANDLLKGGVH